MHWKRRRCRIFDEAEDAGEEHEAYAYEASVGLEDWRIGGLEVYVLRGILIVYSSLGGRIRKTCRTVGMIVACIAAS